MLVFSQNTVKVLHARTYLQLFPTLESVYFRPSGFHVFPAFESWILESFPNFAAKRDQLICGSQVAK